MMQREHGKYDGHLPWGKCHCLTNDTGEMGAWRTLFIYPSAWRTLFIYPTERTWVSCWHESRCPGAGLGDTK